MPECLFNDPLRLEALYQSNLLDSPQERVFDRITEMVCKLLGVPVSLVSLVDADRQFFKSAQGLSEPVASERQTPLSHSFCQHVVSRNQPLIVEDARLNSLVRDNLAIRDLQVVAYLGVPVWLPGGYVAGALCAIDHTPRVWSKEDIATLEDLAQVVTAEIQVRQLLREKQDTEVQLRKQQTQLKLASEVAAMGIFEWDFVSDTLEVSDTLHHFYASEPGQEVTLERFLSLLHPEDLPAIKQKMTLLNEGHDPADLEFRLPLAEGERWIHSKSKLMRNARGEPQKLIGVNFDISEQKKLQLALAESEERYRLISDVASDYMFSARVLASGELEVEWMTEAFSETTGYTLEEFKARGGWQTIVHPDDLALDNEKLSELKRNQTVHFDLRILHKNGNIVWVSNHIHPIWDSKNNCLTRIHGAVQNITARKQMEESLLQSETKFSQLFQNSPFSITIALLDTGRFVNVNDTFLRRTGYARHEVLGKTSFELGLWVDPERRHQLVQLLEETGHVDNFEMEFRAKSGELGTGLISAYILETQGQKHLVVATRNITEEKKAQKALRNSERKFSKLFQRSPVAMSLVSLKNFQIADVNDTFLGISGFSREEIIGKTALELGVWSNPKDRETFFTLFRQQGFVKDFETIFCDKHKQYKSILCSAEVIELEDEKYVVSTMLDISEQREVEKTLRESEQKFSKLFKGSPVSMAVTRYLDHRIMDVNENFLQEGGYLREEVIGKTAYEVGAWTNVEQTEAFIQAFQSQGFVKNFEATMHKKGGQLMYTLLSAEVLELQGEKYVISTILDITSQRIAEQTLRESEQKFSRLFQSSPFAISLSSLEDGRIVDVNESFARETGYAPEEVIGKTAGELNTWVHDEDEGRLYELFRSQGFLRHVLVDMRMRGGRVASVLLWVEPLEVSGKPFLVSTILDITTQLQAEQALRESEAKFSTLFHNNPSPIFVASAKDGCIMDYNEAFLRESEYSREDVLGKTAQDLDVWVYPEDEIKFTQLIQTTGNVRGLEVTFRKPSGAIVHSLISADLVEINHEYHIVATTLDVTAQRKAEQNLRESEARFERIFQNSPFGVLLIDIEADQIVDVNEKFIQDTGYSREEILSTPSFGYNLWVSSREREKAKELLEAQGYLKEFVMEFRHKSGDTGWAQTSAEFFELAGRQYLIRTNRDITDMRKAEEALWESEERYRVVAETASDGIVTIDEQGVIHYLNPGTEKMFGYSERELLNQKISLLLPDYAIKMHEIAMMRFLQADEHKPDWRGIEIMGVTREGKEIPLEISFSEFATGGQRFFTGIIRDISERKLLLNRLEQMAYRDVLTNLPNRAMLRERLDYLLKHHSDTSGLALLFIDLDNFKIINDSLGHEFGDEALKVIARRLGDTIRTDDMVARLGGDEFVVLLNNVASTEDITRVAQKILYRLDYPIHIQSHEVRLGGSMGIALYPQDGRTAMDLLRSADLAMYQAKKEKSVFKFYTKELNERAQERLSLESELRVALANHEISVHYQPRIDLLTGRITGAEALARWLHPQKGFISPGRFIPIAEESGLIHSLGLNVLRQACLQLRQWQKKGYPFFRVSVNLAPQQLHHPNLVSNIQHILEQTGLEPSYLELEVTESGAMSNIKESMPTLQAFRDMGIHIAVDDFGTGYSSLSYLQRLPIDSLKIDRSFLMDIGKSEQVSGEVIARVITSLGKNLGLNVVAEGIETPQQLKFLLQIHCDEAQGFLFSKPLIASDFESYLMTHNTKNLLMQFKQKHPTLFEF